MRTLYILATSPRPDPYINTMIHVMKSFHDVSSIKLVTISGTGSSGTEQAAMTVMSNIERQLDSLCSGKYIPNIGKPEKTESIGSIAQQFYLDYYPRIKEILGTAKIDLSRLSRDLRGLIADGWCLFDVSALRKDLLTDVFAVLLAQEFRELYYFELVEPELPQDSTKGRMDLIHELEPMKDYVFKNLMASKSVQSSLVRIRANLMQFRTAIVTILLVAFIFGVVQVFFQKTWLMGIFVFISLVGAIASAVFLFVDPRKGIKRARRSRLFPW
jgi:hypothetical protein